MESRIYLDDNKPYLLNVIKAELWAKNLKQIIKGKKKSVTKLSQDCNMIRSRLIDNPHYQFHFEKKQIYENYNLLKQFLFSENPTCLELSQIENILLHCGHWKIHGELTMPKIDMSLFSNSNQVIIQMAESIGWIAFDKKNKDFYLTKEGMSQNNKKIYAVCSHPDIRTSLF
jgi:hypothetical protein